MSEKQHRTKEWYTNNCLKNSPLKYQHVRDNLFSYFNFWICYSTAKDSSLREAFKGRMLIISSPYISTHDYTVSPVTPWFMSSQLVVAPPNSKSVSPNMVDILEEDEDEDCTDQRIANMLSGQNNNRYHIPVGCYLLIRYSSYVTAALQLLLLLFPFSKCRRLFGLLKIVLLEH